jgi:hypothetical protein
MDWAGQFTVV